MMYLEPVHTLGGACATTFPSSASFGHPLSSARRPTWGDAHEGSTDRPRPPFRRRPAKSAAFQKARMSSTDTTRAVSRSLRSSTPHAGSLAHAAHTFSPERGEVLWMGIARSRCGHPQGP